VLQDSDRLRATRGMSGMHYAEIDRLKRAGLSPAEGRYYHAPLEADEEFEQQLEAEIRRLTGHAEAPPAASVKSRALVVAVGGIAEAMPTPLKSVPPPLDCTRQENVTTDTPAGSERRAVRPTSPDSDGTVGSPTMASNSDIFNGSVPSVPLGAADPDLDPGRSRRERSRTASPSFPTSAERQTPSASHAPAQRLTPSASDHTATQSLTQATESLDAGIHTMTAATRVLRETTRSLAEATQSHRRATASQRAATVTQRAATVTLRKATRLHRLAAGSLRVAAKTHRNRRQSTDDAADAAAQSAVAALFKIAEATYDAPEARFDAPETAAPITVTRSSSNGSAPAVRAPAGLPRAKSRGPVASLPRGRPAPLRSAASHSLARKPPAARSTRKRILLVAAVAALVPLLITATAGHFRPGTRAPAGIHSADSLGIDPVQAKRDATGYTSAAYRPPWPPLEKAHRMDLSKLSAITQLAGDLCYLFLAVDALWGLYCVVVVWRRLRQARFANEAEQARFLEQWEANVNGDEFATSAGDSDERIVAQLGRLTMENKGLEPVKLRHLLADRFQRDFSSDLEYRMSWINTVIKTAPMLGLFGTVLGMMSAFGKLGGNSGNVEATGLASDISLALITTAIGLAIAIPLSLCVAGLAIQIRKAEDLVNAGLARILDAYTLSLRAVAARRKG
jgi:biopolymer transport protein ExbB